MSFLPVSISVYLSLYHMVFDCAPAHEFEIVIDAVPRHRPFCLGYLAERCIISVSLAARGSSKDKKGDGGGETNLAFGRP